MLEYRINTEDIKKWLEVFEQMPDIFMEETSMAMKKAVSEVERQTVTRTPVNTGQLRQAWSTNVHKGAASVKGEVVNPREYAIVMEKGRRPGAKMPPVDALQLWVVRKLGVHPDEARQVAFLVARSISRKGIKGRKMLEEGYKAAEPTVNRLFAAVPENVIKRIA